MIKNIVLLGIIALFGLWACAACADVTIGQAVTNILGPVKEITGFIRIVCIIVGAGLLFGSLLQYGAHRKNPAEVRMSNVLMLLVAGIAMLALAFIPMGK